MIHRKVLEELEKNSYISLPFNAFWWSALTHVSVLSEVRNYTNCGGIRFFPWTTVSGKTLCGSNLSFHSERRLRGLRRIDFLKPRSLTKAMENHATTFDGVSFFNFVVNVGGPIPMLAPLPCLYALLSTPRSAEKNAIEFPFFCFHNFKTSSTPPIPTFRKYRFEKWCYPLWHFKLAFIVLNEYIWTCWICMFSNWQLFPPQTKWYYRTRYQNKIMALYRVRCQKFQIDIDSG